MIATNATDGDKNAQSKVGEKKKRDQDLQNILRAQQMQKDLQELNDYIEQLQERALLLRQEIEQIDIKIGENKKLIDEIIERREVAQEALKHFEEDGVLEPGPDRRLKNNSVQQLLDAYKKRTGKEPESDAVIALSIRAQIEFEKREEERLQKLSQSKPCSGLRCRTNNTYGYRQAKSQQGFFCGRSDRKS